MTFMFRIRFRLPDGESINCDDLELVLREGPERRVAIKPQTADLTVKQERNFALRGERYPTGDDAAADGARWVSAMTVGFISEFIPADFEMRAPRSGFYHGMLDAMSADNGVAAHNDDPGLIVLPEDPPPVFSRFRADVVAGRNEEGTVRAILDAYEAGLTVNDRVVIAYDMFSAAQNMPPGDSDARFLMLMIAVEALIDPGKRPETQIAVLGELRARLDTMEGVEVDDVKAVKDALRQLQDESIGSAGRRLASSLGDRQYFDSSPIDFFRKCYSERSNLVHANLRRPDPELIRLLIGPLQSFVRDLIRLNAGADWPHPRES